MLDHDVGTARAQSRRMGVDADERDARESSRARCDTWTVRDGVHLPCAVLQGAARESAWLGGGNDVRNAGSRCLTLRDDWGEHGLRRVDMSYVHVSELRSSYEEKYDHALVHQAEGRDCECYTTW